MTVRGVQLSDAQRFHWLRLIRSDNVGPATFRDLINRFGSAETALQALPELSARGGARRKIRIPSESEISEELDKLNNAGAQLVGIGEPDYPTILRSADQAPPLLTVKGNPSVFALPPVAMVGARNASLAGIKFAKKIADDLGASGFSVVSGLARGIDTAAHEGSLTTGTIAAVAGGIDVIYPPQNENLYKSIIDNNGAIVSEMPFGWKPRAKDFPRRNRIIAGLCLGLAVIEAAKRSGSLISARLAGEMGRLVFAVPGSPLDPRAAGSNSLLKQGATLITSANDIIDAVRPMLDNPPHPPEQFEEPPDFSSVPPPDDLERSVIISALGPTPVAIDELIQHTGLHPAQVQMVLLELDLAGRLERHSGGAVSLLPAGLDF